MGTTAPDGSQLVTPVNIPIHPIQLFDSQSLGINSTQIGASNQNNQFLNACPPDAGNTPLGWAGPFSATQTQVLFSVDTTGYGTVSVQITSAGSSCTITYEASNDGQTWVSTLGLNNSINAALGSTTGGTGIYNFICTARYFRARVSGYSSGTVTVWYSMRSNVFGALTPIAQAGQTITVLSSLTPSSAVGATYTHIAAGQATTVIKNTSGILFSITLNTQASATNTTIFYDNASTSSALIVATIPAVTAAAGTMFQYGGAYGLATTIGLTVITATANGGDMTVCWK